MLILACQQFFPSTSCFVLRKVSKMTCFFSLPIFKYNSAHSRTRIFTFFYFISLHSRQLPTPHPFLSRQLNRHCSRVVVVVLGISLLYISSIHSALAALLFLPSRQSTKRKQQYSPVGVALTFHLFFPLILFFISFMLRTCDLWT